ncbi:ribulose-phosphate 3-epimerase [Bdellovibrionota bacterium FG-2]
MKKVKTLIAPSILAADFLALGAEIQSIEEGGADWIHVDVMDGHFVPNLTMGPPVVAALKRVTKLPLDCHLMVSNPENWVAPFVKVGARVVTVHAEATVHLDRLIHHIQSFKILAGVAINPATPLAAIEEVLGFVDLVLIMSVNPGFGGQEFIKTSLTKIRRLAELRKVSKASFLVEVDGGVSADNALALRRAGVDVLVAGSAVFSGSDRAHAIAALRKGAV